MISRQINHMDGVPRNLEGALDLRQRDKYHSRKWAVDEVDGFVTARKTGDGGIDGRPYFARPGTRDLRSMVIEVKGGKNVGVGAVRDLRGVLERDNAETAGLIVLKEMGDRKCHNFTREMASAGDLNIIGVPYPRMQLLHRRRYTGRQPLPHARCGRSRRRVAEAAGP